MAVLSEVDRALLAQMGVGRDEVIAAAVADLDKNCILTYSKLVLMRDRLICIAADKADTRDHFGAAEPPNIDGAAEPTVYMLAEVRGALLLSNVSGATLCLKTKYGDRLVCAVTNTYIKEMRELERRINELTCRGEARRERPRGEHKPPRPEPERPRMGPPHMMPPEPSGKRRRLADAAPLVMRVGAFFMPYKWLIVGAFVLTLLMAALDLVTPYLSGTVLFGMVLERDAALAAWLAQNGLDFAEALFAVVAAMLAVKLVGLLLGALKDACMAVAVPRVVRDIKSQVFSAINRLPLSFYYNRETGSLMTRVLSDADQVSTLFIDNLPTVFIDTLTIIGAAVMLFYINWVIAVAMLFIAPAAILMTRGIMARLSTMHSRRHRAERSMSSHINDNLTGARVIKAFGREAGELARFDAGNKKVRDAEVDIITTESRMGAAFQFAGTMSNTLIFGIGAFLILSAVTELGYSDLITVSMYAGMLSGPLGNIARLMQQWAQSMNSAERIFEIIDARSDITESAEPIKLDKVRGDISLRDVRFSYTRGEPVLEDINLDIRAGELLGVVGRSGAGKSTLVNLISRLYDPDEGEILIDGINIKELSFETLRGLVSMVSQETYIFMGTVAENIAYARPDATRDEIVRAAVSAGAHDFICKLPDGYDTVIGTSGRELSGGERQRLSIARAVLTDPRILILDEATASVDTQTELAIQLSLDRLTEGRTTISIAHRLSTLRTADRLIVLEDGKLVESGTHAELLAQGGLFSHLAELQRKALMMKGLDE